MTWKGEGGDGEEKEKEEGRNETHDHIIAVSLVLMVNNHLQDPDPLNRLLGHIITSDRKWGTVKNAPKMAGSFSRSRKYLSKVKNMVLFCTYTNPIFDGQWNTAVTSGLALLNTTL